MTGNIQSRSPKFRIERFLGFFFLLPAVINVFFLLYSMIGNFIGRYFIEEFEEHIDYVFVMHLQSMWINGLKANVAIEIVSAFLVFSAFMAFIGVILIIFTSRKEFRIAVNSPKTEVPVNPFE
jgi:hypothetical protein